MLYINQTCRLYTRFIVVIVAMIQCLLLSQSYMFYFSGGVDSLPQQERHRFVLRASGAGGDPCPTLRETRPCSQLPRCVTYHWHVPPWSHCLFAQRYHKCGHGYRARGMLSWTQSQRKYVKDATLKLGCN